MNVTLEFRRRGTPETTPPKSTKTAKASAAKGTSEQKIGDFTGMFGLEQGHAAS